MHDRILKEALKRIKPSSKDLQDELNAATRIIKQVREFKGLHVDAVLLGSAARGTAIKGSRDLDIFVLYPESLPEKVLEQEGLSVGMHVAKGHKWKLKYSSHPYVSIDYDGLDVEIVPAFKVASAEKIKSAVDRTPFHASFVKATLKSGQADEVLLLKQFLKGLGIYGADIGTKGFSGYLCELLVIKHGSFENTLKAASSWNFGELIDLKSHAKVKHSDPLIVVDPVDSKRNVASAVSSAAMAKLIHYSRTFLKKPSIDYFFPAPSLPFKPAKVKQVLGERGTELIVLKTAFPKAAEDIALSQLERARSKLKDLVELHDFKVHRTDIIASEESAYLVFEFEVHQLPKYRLHLGPPLTEVEHQEAFLQKALKDKRNVWIEEGRWHSEKERAYTSAARLLEDFIEDARTGKVPFVSHVTEALKEKASFLKGESLLEEFKESKAFAQGLSDYLAKRERFLEEQRA